ncbi:MAG: glycosyltransferase family 1 protein [Nitrospirae bacterium]|nr:MAG: glycosyltransferase family 1 protein [Nitrospirota bacterium]
MKILLVHNRYKNPGGEDSVFAAEADLLRHYGHTVEEYIEDNQRLDGEPSWRAGLNAVWSSRTQAALAQQLRRFTPDIVHFHNTFLRVSPAAYYTCHQFHVPVVQTLHNYRLLCPAALLFRDGHVCEECVGKMIPYPAILHGCWRGSRAQTVVPASVVTLHKWMQTWDKKVDVYIVFTEFARRKFEQGGLPADKIMVKPNFVHPDPGIKTGKGQYALFVGRLSYEKGLSTLLTAWETLAGRVPLKIVGAGPLAENVANVASRIPGVELVGHQSRSDVFALMDDAAFLIFPSECYEGFPLVLIEAFAKGLPVIASELGAHGSIVEDGCSGLHFAPRNSEDLANKVAWAWAHRDAMEEMGRHARWEYEHTFEAEGNYQMLMAIYERAMSK